MSTPAVANFDLVLLRRRHVVRILERLIEPPAVGERAVGRGMRRS